MIGKYRCMELDCRRWLNVVEPGITPDHHSPMTEMRCPASGERVACNTPYKHSFASAKEARRFISRLSSTPHIRSPKQQVPYQCICGLYHLRRDKSQ